MNYIGEVFQDRRRVFLDQRNKHYHERNIKCDIVFVGDSITEAFNLSYAGATTKVIVNSGISGDRVRNLHHRLNTDVIELGPKQVVLMIGINDILSEKPNTVENYQENIEQLFTDYQTNVERLIEANIEVVCCGIIHVQLYEHNYMFVNQQIDYYNRLVETLANQHNLKYIDYNLVLGDEYGAIENGYFLDGLHPNEKGYFEMFKLLCENEVL